MTKNIKKFVLDLFITKFFTLYIAFHTNNPQIICGN